MKKLYIFALSLVSMLAITSCSDYLTPENKKTGGQTAEGFFSSDPSSLLTYAYSKMKPVVSRTDLFVKGTDLYMMSHLKQASQFQSYIFTPENADVKSFYSQCYACINAANAVLYYDKDAKYSDEAIFIRSYMYYVLTQQFGSVPYVTEYINNANREYPRTPLADIYAGLEADLEKLTTSATLADEDHTGHASKRAATALLAKVYLAAAWDLNTTVADAAQGTYTVSDKTNFAKAAQWAEKAIKMGATQDLSMEFEDKWLPSNEGNGEEFFSVQYDLAGYPGAVADGGHGLQNHYGSYFDNPAKTGGKYSDSEDVPTRKAAYMWEKGDKRFEATFMTTWYGYDGSNYDLGYFAYYNKDAATQATLPIWRKFFPWYTTDAEITAYLAENKDRFSMNVQVLAPKAYLMADKMACYTFSTDGTPSKALSTVDYMTQVYEGLDYAPTVKKWDDPNSLQSNGSTNCYRDIVLLHLSETFLVAAEAELLAGNETKALEYVNAVRARAGLASTTFATYDPEYANEALQPIDLILDERARELYAEGHRWMDLRRTKQLVHYNVAYSYYINDASEMANNAGEYKWYRPIPQAEINSNDALTDADQNPGY